MKHTYTVILAILLVIALAVPAFASDYSYNGNILPDISTIDIDREQYPYVVFAKNGNFGNFLYFMRSMKHYTSSGFLTGSNTMVYYVNKDSGNWKYHGQGEYDVTPLWSNYDIKKSDGTIFLHASEPGLLICDGTSCPANDMNADGICDDCGMTLSLRLTGYPALPTVDGANKHTVLTQDSSGYNYYVFTGSSAYTVSGTATSQLLVEFNKSVNWNVYRCTDGRNWVETASSSGYQYGMGSTSDINILSSTFTFYDADGNPFFPRPLWEEMGQVTQGEMVAMTQETMETMRTILLCGVGLLALLIGLNLFGKVLGIFRT